MAVLTCSPSQVREDANGLLVFVGPPDVAVLWSLAGSGTLTILTTVTDSQGRAYARLNPAAASAGETVTVTVTHGT